jgi:hypothetical protein
LHYSIGPALEHVDALVWPDRRWQLDLETPVCRVDLARRETIQEHRHGGVAHVMDFEKDNVLFAGHRSQKSCDGLCTNWRWT